jgi:hypothetical protein
LGVWGDFFGFCLSDITFKGFFDVSDAIGYVISGALSNHLNGAVWQIAGQAGQLIAIGYIKCCEAEADTLDSASEDYMFGGLVHCDPYDKLKRFLVQVGNSEVN